MKFAIAALAAVLVLAILPQPSQTLSSGVSISNKVETTFNEIKLQKKFRYVVLVIRNEREIDVETVGLRAATYADFMRDVEVGGKAECRFGVFDMEQTKCKALFTLQWCPSTATTRQKVLYSSSFLELKSALKGVAGHVQATDRGELSQESVFASNVCTTKTVI